MSKDDILLEAEMAMEKSVDYLIHEFSAVRTGKASPALVENLDVQAYGSTMKLKQLALITTPESRLLVVQPFDAGTVQDIERALKESKIGITPAVDGKVIRLPIPELSEERRKELVKSLSKMAEEARVRVRGNIEHPAPGILYIAGGGLLEYALSDVMCDLVAQIFFHLGLDAFLVQRVDLANINIAAPEKLAVALI